MNYFGSDSSRLSRDETDGSVPFWSCDNLRGRGARVGVRGGGWWIEGVGGYLVCKHDGSVTKINVRQSSQHCRSCLSRVRSARAVNLRPDFFWSVCVCVCVLVFACM